MHRRIASAALAALLFVTAQGFARDPKPDIAPPKELDTPAVPYPDGAKGDAVVVLELVIGEDGSVTNASVREGPAPFAERARLYVLAWRFEPASRNGLPVRARILARIAFKYAPPRPPTPPAPESEPGASRPAEPRAAKPPADEPVEIEVLGDIREELGSTHVPRSETRLIPGAFADPFRVVEILPGVAPVLSGLPYFFVRGAPPGNVGYLIDGIRVPLLFHVGAGPSVIAPALVDRVDLYPSAYPARFGRVVGGVMAGETTEPSERGRAEAQARVFDAGAMIEQPFAGGRGSVAAGGRYGYTGALLALVAPDYGLDYYDYQGRLSYAVGRHDRLSAFAFGASDQLENVPLDRTLFDVRFHRLDLRWDRATESQKLRAALTLSRDHALNAEDDTLDEGSVFESQGARLRFEIDHKLSHEVRLRAGSDLGIESVSTEREQHDQRVVVFPAREDLYGGAWTDAVLRPLRGVEMVPGARVDLQRIRDRDHVSIDPRLATRLKVVSGVAWVAAFGIAHQLPTSNVRVPGLAPSALEVVPQEAWQASQGVELLLPESLLAKVTAFHSWIDATSGPLRGRNYGLELFLRRDFTERLGGFLSYTLSRTERTFGSRTFLSSFDRTHVLSAVLGYDLGGGYRIGGRAYYTGGRPYEIACPTPDCGPAQPTTNVYVRSGRLEDFFRLDLRFEKRWTFASGAYVAAAFEWFNALLADEMVGANWAPEAGLFFERQSPLTLPSVGIEAGY